MIIDLRAESERRERYKIVLADAIREMFALSDPEDPEPFQPAIVEIVAEVRAYPVDELESFYKSAVAFFVTAPGGIVHIEADPAPNHEACLDWARQYLARIERNFGVQLLDQTRVR